jgi:hypothetical protein
MTNPTMERVELKMPAAEAVAQVREVVSKGWLSLQMQ